jgi:hypothetical protein
MAPDAAVSAIHGHEECMDGVSALFQETKIVFPIARRSLRTYKTPLSRISTATGHSSTTVLEFVHSCGWATQ